MLIAEDADGELIGCVGVNFGRVPAPDESSADGPFALVANLAVAKRGRRRGLAKKLMAAAEAFVREDLEEEEAILLVDQKNVPARRLYERLGYKRRWADPDAKALEVVDGSVVAQPVLNLCMRKNVSGSAGALVENLRWQDVALLAAIVAGVAWRDRLAELADPLSRLLDDLVTAIPAP